MLIKHKSCSAKEISLTLDFNKLNPDSKDCIFKLMIEKIFYSVKIIVHDVEFTNLVVRDVHFTKKIDSMILSADDASEIVIEFNSMLSLNSINKKNYSSKANYMLALIILYGDKYLQIKDTTIIDSITHEIPNEKNKYQISRVFSMISKLPLDLQYLFTRRFYNISDEAGSLLDLNAKFIDIFDYYNCKKITNN